MDAYTYKCPFCKGQLEFSPNDNRLLCNYCCQAFSVEELESPEGMQSLLSEGKKEEKSTENTAEIHFGNGFERLEGDFAEPDAAYMEINLYHCASCGAQLMTNDVEVSKYCSYCGQSTIMFDRVSKERRPDFVIPFSVTKEEALSAAKERFGKGKFLPDEVKKLSVESIYGIYMPYWVFDSEYSVKADVSGRANNSTFHYVREERMEEKAAFDASFRFNDYASQFLNPFPMERAVPFSEAYLSGFFADCSDVKAAAREKDVKPYLHKKLVENMLDKMQGVPNRQMREKYAELYEKSGALRVDILDENLMIHSSSYYFMPVYFITFKVMKKHIIILVNGATGKVVGSVPYDKEKLRREQKKKMVTDAVLMGLVGACIFRFMPALWAVFVMLVFGLSFIFAGNHAKKRYETMYRRTNTDAMFSLSKNRESR